MSEELGRWPYPFPKPIVARFGLADSLDCEVTFGWTRDTGGPTDLPAWVVRRMSVLGWLRPAWALPAELHFGSAAEAWAALLRVLER